MILKNIGMALEYASSKHKHQLRKDNTPYINHPLAVFNTLVQSDEYSENTLVAAILHEVVGDSDGSFEEIEDLFNKEISMLVKDCTDDKRLKKDVRKLSQIKKQPKINKESLKIKIADKIVNIDSLIKTPPVNWDLERRQGYILWTDKVILRVNPKEYPEKLFNLYTSIYDNACKEYNLFYKSDIQKDYIYKKYIERLSKIDD